MTLIKLLFTLFLITLSPLCLGKNTMQDMKIYYKLDIQTEGMRYYIMINGITIQKDTKGYPLQLEMPVGQFIRSGKNTINVVLFPWKKTKELGARDDSQIILTLKMYREDRKELNGIVISQLKYSVEDSAKGNGFQNSTKEGLYKFTDELILDDQGTYDISPLKIKNIPQVKGALEVTQIVTMQTPYPEWGFFKSDRIKKNFIPQTEDMSKDEFDNKFSPSLFAKYKSIHTALKNKDINSIMPMFAERNRELDVAFYYKEGTYEKMFRESLQEEFDNNMLLKDIDIDYAQAYVSLYGNLVKMGDALIVFYDEEKTVFNNYDIFFRKEGDDWIISR